MSMQILDIVYRLCTIISVLSTAPPKQAGINKTLDNLEMQQVISLRKNYHLPLHYLHLKISTPKRTCAASGNGSGNDNGKT